MMGAINKTNFNFTKIGVMTLNSYFSEREGERAKTQSLINIKTNVMNETKQIEWLKSLEDTRYKRRKAAHENKC